ncbi:MAG TPA: hypothetical protein VL326_09235 [Kofleriaceae bacterium]|nr:hypothetical protein [Kofleriaceae bacterium]
MRAARLIIGLVASALALGACSADEEAPPAQRVELPGTLWYMRGTTLMRYAHGTTTVIAHDIYPSTSVLPDGRIVAIASRGDGESGEQLALIAPTGHITRLGPLAAQVRDPAVTSDGIVVAMNVDGHSELYRVAANGDTARLTNNPEGNFHPSAAGNDVVYASSRDGDSEIYKGAQRLTSFYKDDFDPVLSPDGRMIVFSSDREGVVRLFVMASDGTGLRRVTDRPVTDEGEESDPVFSRGGSMLAYVAGGHVFVRGQDETGHAVERDIGAGTSATFSPDGRWLAVATANGMLSVFPNNGGDPVPVAQGVSLVRWF